MQKAHMFDKGPVFDLLRENTERMKEQIAKLRCDQIVDRDDQELAAYFAQEFRGTLPVLGNPPYQVEHPSLAPGEQMTKVVVRVPFEGDAVFFQVRGSHSHIIYREFKISENLLTIAYEIPRNDMQALAKERDEDIGKIRETFANMERLVSNYNEKLAKEALPAIQARKAELVADSQFLDSFAQHGFTLQRRDDPPAKVLQPTRRVKLEYPKPGPGAPQQHALVDSSYEDILRTIQAMAVVFERNPTVFKTMPEEWLTTILIVGLNATYEGKASRETFTGDGKADIFLNEGGNNVFIAECLMWKGPEYIRGKLDDQLFRYATWRDSKLALIVFHRGKNFSEVVTKMRATVSSHPQRVSDLPYSHPTGARYLFHRADDPQQRFTLTCLAFHIVDD